MFKLPLDKAQIKTVKDHQYYVFPAPPTHTNTENRPTVYPKDGELMIYGGAGSNGSAKLNLSIHTAADLFMSALLEYGDAINDWSIRSAVIQSGWRPDDATQGYYFLLNIKAIVAKNFPGKQFPADLEEEAQSELGNIGDPRLTKLINDVAKSPGWDQQSARDLFNLVLNVYAPRGFNPHATGLVFDVDFTMFYNGIEKQVNAYPDNNPAALQSAAGMWINTYSMAFCFDSYNTAKEIWHMEYRNCPPPAAGKKVPFYS